MQSRSLCLLGHQVICAVLAHTFHMLLHSPIACANFFAILYAVFPDQAYLLGWYQLVKAGSLLLAFLIFNWFGCSIRFACCSTG